MTVRQYDVNSGISSSDAPTTEDPVVAADLTSKGYSDKTYALRENFGYDVASYAALKALGTTGDDKRSDTQVRLVTGTGELWRFDSSSSATDDGATILAPDSGSGRWLIVTGGGGSGGGGTPGLETLIEKTQSDQIIGFKKSLLDTSVEFAPFAPDVYAEDIGYFIADVASTDTIVPIIWNPKPVNSSDKDIDSATSWAAAGAGATLTLTTTAGEFKVGTGALKFNKGSSAVEARIDFNHGGDTFSVANNTSLYFYIKLPSVTDLSAVRFKILKSTTTNFGYWDVATNSEGGSLVVGWNLIKIDLTSAQTGTGGSGCAYTELHRYSAFGVVTGSAAQTYTGIIIDAAYFGIADLNKIGILDKEHTIYDTSNKEDAVLASATTNGDGLVTLGAGLTNSFSGGMGGAVIARSTLVFDTVNKGVIFDADNNSGAMANEQEHRTSRVFSETYNGAVKAFIDFEQSENFFVTAVSTGSIDVESPTDLSTNVLDTATFDVYSVYYDRESKSYVWKESVTMNANSSWSSGTLTVPVADEGTVAVGDFISKRALTSELSLVAAGADESFSALSRESNPNGSQVIDESIPIPFPDHLDYFWKVGALSDAEAIVNRGQEGSTADFVKTGSPSLSVPISVGMYGMNLTTSSNYLATADSLSLTCNGLGAASFEFLFWVKRGLNTTATSFNILECISNHITAANGWYLGVVESGPSIKLVGRAASSSDTMTLNYDLPVNKWSLVYGFSRETISSVLWVNGNKVTGTGLAIGSVADQIYYGAMENGIPTGAEDTIFGELLIYGSVGVRLFSDAQLTSIYNGGAPRPFGTGVGNRYKYSALSQSGQKMSMKVKASRSSTSFNGPRVKRYGAIKG